MTPLKTQRRIRRSTHVRASGESGKSRRTRRGDAARVKAKGIPVSNLHHALHVWLIAFSVVAFLAVIGFLGFWLRSHRRAPIPADINRVEKHEPDVVRLVPLTAADAPALVRNAIANRDPELVSTYMHLGETDPAEAIEFMKGMEARDGSIESISWVESLDVDGTPIESVRVVCSRDFARNQRLALLVPDETGAWKMDFEGFARVCRPSWKDFFGKRMDGSRVRVRVTKDSYYNGPFSDDSLWECFALASPDLKEVLPDGQEALRGYCRRDSPQAKAMKRLFENDAQMKRAILDIRRTRNAGPRQFEITRVLSEDWVMTSKPLDEKFE